MLKLWAILMRKANAVILAQAAHPEFLGNLERVVTSPAIEMVAIDRLVAVLATIIYDKQFQE
jgi:hypothetical protein